MAIRLIKKGIAIPAGDIANDLGNPAMANMVCLGALLPKLTMVNMTSVEKAMDALTGKKKPELWRIGVVSK
ncbi:pyruvate ferredoxin/flavodoxin oxidoreductase [Lucifera butyrica]|uniref:Pyruvate ferredoxin/flavodoxin oxidoreductase n=1 Tax=Lucifera butyrica TaxID=1351585 RepID=A0A498REN2_9FIRM|nr:2-oxoacid:acceptor oxidoreductase family protein [Lucifera butyrica]VBB07638.1 pyruvate ferredoxin/flavodoxin oxidoreductase [Lucifera butyrica]